eukprot:m.113176 g.113176  ORF g.113176 m.113176 type:complete len:59 (+) comp14122_c0_seq4:1443-1619(+)
MPTFNSRSDSRVRAELHPKLMEPLVDIFNTNFHLFMNYDQYKSPPMMVPSQWVLLYKQ